LLQYSPITSTCNISGANPNAAVDSPVAVIQPALRESLTQWQHARFGSECVILCHQQPITKDLSSEFEVVAMDCRGHGKSDKPHDPKQYGIEIANDVLRLMDHLGIKKAIVIGYSMGGSIAMKMLTEHPDRVSPGDHWRQPGIYSRGI
jgi:pimeloyl-ACP methyl ester carboxylesterase